MRIPRPAARVWPCVLLLFALNACSSSGTSGLDGGVEPVGDGGPSSEPVPDAGPYDAGVVVTGETNPCESTANPAGEPVDLLWPAPNNSGHDALEGQTVHFHWDDGAEHNVLQLPLWRGQSAPLGTYDDAHWPLELRSGDKSTSGIFDWNVGTSPCGWRPGLYYLADEGNPASGITALSLTVPEGQSHAFDARACATLTDPTNFRARYAAYASRPDCRVFEVNNFQTEAHYDWVPATFAATQGDLVVFRWTGLHNVVQTHDQSQDSPVQGGIFSGPRTNCVGGPNYGCVNGSLDLGEYLLDTKNYRPGMIHISDQCAYGCEGCPWDCDNVTDHSMYAGTPFLLFLQRPERPAPPTPGACCAIDKSKGQACRVIDLYNDNDGTQFDTGLGGGITVNRGDLVRFRWSGSVRIVQTVAEDTSTGVASQTPMVGGASMDAPVECVPGPDWTCLGGQTDRAQFIFDVDRAMKEGKVQSFSYGGKFVDFYAFADNRNDPYSTTQSSAILLPIDDEAPYADNPPCP